MRSYHFMRSHHAIVASLLSATVLMAAFSPRVHAETPKTIGEVERIDPDFDKLVAPGVKLEVLADGFEWSEGPEWNAKEGYLLFCDIPNNRIHKWKDGEGLSTYLEPSGYTGEEKFTGGEPGTNGLMYDAKGRLWLCAHGDRCIKRQRTEGKRPRDIVTHYEDKRLNSPNDLVFHSNGDLYFTDPPYGLPKRYEDPARELDWCGVYRYGADKSLTLLTKEMTRPNGVAFSPDFKTLYVAQSDPKAALWKKFAVKDDGTLGEGVLFFDATKWVGERPGLPDGMAVDVNGNVWATGPGGVYVFSPAGKLLGRISTGERTANCTFGGPDGKTLYITADMFLCRIQTLVQGFGEGPAIATGVAPLE